ncbi:MAG TPA: nucleotide exchange factor GrpE [Bacilli bacterium]|jgi:molecular chaperone GrpE|nr:nucleotide exchange factor GrpE [Bacilli bacterium]HPZ27723.1 nucleotide exchange factor GrpE [Bacilli bacterium]HQC90098.1 nucleotide exchange factor GrpE [Bacilli bacterium]
MYNRYREEEKQEKELKQTEAETSGEETAAETEATGEETPVAPAEEKDAAGEETLDLEEEVKRLKDLYLRTLADAENFKRRINEERIRERKYAAQGLLEKLISVIDIFDQAIGVETDDPKLKNFLTGFTIINKQLNEILEEEGVKKIDARDQIFDPAYHHAVEVEHDENKEDNIVLEVYQNGYTFKDRVLRPALVKVNKSKKEENIDHE